MLRSSATTLLCALSATSAVDPYPYTHTNCGVEHTFTEAPQRVVTMNHGATEFMLAMGLQDNMAGTANLADEIWPRYQEAYDKIPVLSTSYPTDEQIMNVSADFIFASWRSAFREYEPPRVTTEDTSGSKGTWSNKTVGPCNGVNSDYFPAGANTTTAYSTCRPQLHAAGIGTWLEPVSCEDETLRMNGTEETIYWAITTIGDIFNVPDVASQLIAEMKNDFNIAQQTLAASSASGHSLTAVWLDCVSCCQSEPEPSVFVGSGGGAPNLIMQESGFINPFADRENSWACVTLTDIIAANPDVMIIVEADFDPALDKIDFLHNHSGFCGTPFVRNADYIKMPFSASTLGPRNGAAALDMVAAAIHVTTGDPTMNFQSGVDFFDPEVLEAHTAGLLCPVVAADLTYSGAPSSPSSPPAEGDDDDDLPSWGIALVVVFCVLFVLVLACACVMFLREKQGNPIFVSLKEVQTQKSTSTESSKA